MVPLVYYIDYQLTANLTGIMVLTAMEVKGLDDFSDDNDTVAYI